MGCEETNFPPWHGKEGKRRKTGNSKRKIGKFFEAKPLDDVCKKRGGEEVKTKTPKNKKPEKKKPKRKTGRRGLEKNQLARNQEKTADKRGS